MLASILESFVPTVIYFLYIFGLWWLVNKAFQRENC